VDSTDIFHRLNKLLAPVSLSRRGPLAGRPAPPAPRRPPRRSPGPGRR
jgi:hypothetical protein